LVILTVPLAVSVPATSPAQRTNLPPEAQLYAVSPEALIYPILLYMSELLPTYIPVEPVPVTAKLPIVSVTMAVLVVLTPYAPEPVTVIISEEI
jgi:hypothetical protein